MEDERRMNEETGRVSVEAEERRSYNNNLPNFLLSVRLKYVKLGYHYLISHAMYLMLVPLLGAVSVQLSTVTVEDLVILWEQLRFNLVSVILCSALLVFLGTLYFMTRPRKVYLVDFACYKPGPEVMCPKEIFMERSKQAGSFSEENLAFQKKILERSGLGQKTYFPAASMTTAGDSKVTRSTVSAAVGALLKWKAQLTSEKPQQLLPQDDFIYLNLTLKKIPPKSRTNPFKIPLRHPLFDPTAEVCLIIDDRPNSNLTSETTKKIVKAQNIPVSKVLKLSKLKSNYKPFEAKRKLCDSYELFLVDRRIVHMLPKLLGKFFFKKKKLPLPLDLTHKNWKEQIERAMGCGFLFMRTGTCCVMKVGKISMESEEIVDNIVEGINGVVKVVPKKWAGVRSLHLKLSDSVALPIYQALPDVKLRIDGSVPSEKVRETEVKEVSSGGEEKKDKEKKKKKKKKGRIHEVQYMDVGVGAVELECEDDEDKNKEMKEMDAEEKVVGNDGKQGNESEKSENDNDDEDIDSDLEVKNRKKEKLVRGLEKKARKVEKSGKGEAKKSRSLPNTIESGEKKEKKKSKLGARMKGGSIMKKSTRSSS